MLPKTSFSLPTLSFLEKAMKKKKHIFDVRHDEKTVEPNGKVHIPKKFLDSLHITAGDRVIVALYEGDQTIRIRKKKLVYDSLYTEKNGRSDWKSLHSQTVS